jgi:hypothetical protein
MSSATTEIASGHTSWLGKAWDAPTSSFPVFRALFVRSRHGCAALGPLGAIAW